MQLAEKLLGLFGLTDVKAWIQHTHDRKFNDRRYAVDGSKLHKLGWKQRTKFETALEATVDWYGKFSGWFGDIEGVLTAHPVVKGDQVTEQVEVLIKSGIDQDVKAGAFEQSAMAVDGGGVVSPKVKLQAAAAMASNGQAQNGGKKRKADLISSE
jgi:hypothetical protein